MHKRQKNIKIFLSSLLVVVLLSGVSFSYAAAQDTQLPGTEDTTEEGEGVGAGDSTGESGSTSTGGLPDVPGNIPTDPEQLIQNILNWIMSILAATAVLFIVIGGFRYTTSAGNQKLIEGAKKMILNALIGLFIAILALVLVNTIGSALLFGSGSSAPPSGTTPPIAPAP